jgi:hypothetical protein
MSIRFEKKAVVIDDTPTFIFSGEFAYYRVPQESWEDRLGRLKAGGLNCVGLYFAWNFHSQAAGQYDFTSYGHDINRLLEIVGRLGLYAVARPGPYICNEWDLGGYPSWLLGVDSGDWRSSDPQHLRYLREWYSAVNPILARHQHDAGGPIILYQIENEYRWSDKGLLDALFDYALEDGITVPLIGNHDGGAVSSGAKVTDAIDTYTGVGERYRWRGWAQAMYHRIGPEAPLMVLEFRGCDMSLWGDPAPSEERLPASWIVAQEKMFTAIGANLTNRFIAAGGLTPRDYYSDHITTEYGARAAVAPWGDVTATKSFALMRMWGEFIGSVNKQLAVSKPWHLGWGTTNPQVECLARRGPEGVFFTLINVSGESQTARIVTPEPMAICKHDIETEAGEFRVLVADLKVAGLTIVYSTAEILKIATLNGRPYIVLFGREGTQGRIEFAHDGGSTEVAVELSARPTVRSERIGSMQVTVFGVSNETALRTWFLPTVAGLAPLFTNVDLMLAGDSPGQGQIEVAANGKLQIFAPVTVAGIDIGGVGAVCERDEAGLAEWRASVATTAAPAIHVGPLEARVESDWTLGMPADPARWRRVQAYGNRAEIVLKPGHLRWITEFDLSDQAADTIEMLGISGAEIEAYLNGVPIGVFPKVRPAGYPFMPSFGASFDVEDAIRPGKNVLAVSMNIAGRHNCGQPIYCGFSAPVVLRGRQREEFSLPAWSASPFDDRRWFTGELAAVPAQAQPGYDRTGWQTIDLTIPEAHLWLRQTDVRHRVRWYHATITVPETFLGRPIFLQTSPVEEAWIYVNGELAARKLSGTSSIYDLTRFCGGGDLDITIAVRHNWYFFNETWGMSDAPKLVAATQTIAPEWLLSAGTEGEHDHWATEDRNWREPDAFDGVRDIWVRRTVEVEARRGGTAPVYVEMAGWRTHADICWNGVPIGLYASVGPQTRFFVPDSLVCEHNQVVAHVTGYGAAVVAGSLDVKSYGARRFEPLETRSGVRSDT